MAIFAGTTTKYDVVGAREDLTDAIYDISPEKTPFYSSIGRGTAKGTFHEWQTDSLADADGTNAQLEGNEASYAKADPTVRVGNYTQISDKSLIVSGTLQAIDLAGRKSEKARLLAKRSKEIKRDIEKILLGNQAAAAGSDTVARKLASLGAWVKTNVNKHADGTNPTYSSGAPGAARGDGTQRVFTLAMVQDVMQRTWAAGGEPTILQVGPFNKTKVSTFTGIATKTVNISSGDAGPMAVIAAVDILVTDFGNLRVVPNRLQRDRDAWVLDLDMFEVDYLRQFHTENMAKTGDADKTVLRVEYTLKVKNEKGVGLVADLTVS
jgi:hypothetical protein